MYFIMLLYFMLDYIRDIEQGLLFWLFKGVSKSVQALLKGTEAVMVLTLMILKWQAC